MDLDRNHNTSTLISVFSQPVR